MDAADHLERHEWMGDQGLRQDRVVVRHLVEDRGTQRVGGEAPEDVQALGLLQVEYDGTLGAVHVVVPVHRVAVRAVDLDHVGAEKAELAARERARENA